MVDPALYRTLVSLRLPLHPWSSPHSHHSLTYLIFCYVRGTAIGLQHTLNAQNLWIILMLVRPDAQTLRFLYCNLVQWPSMWQAIVPHSSTKTEANMIGEAFWLRQLLASIPTTTRKVWPWLWTCHLVSNVFHVPSFSHYTDRGYLDCPSPLWHRIPWLMTKLKY